MDKITKLPWHTSPICENQIFGTDANRICTASNKADAEYICLAVNSHEGLVEALRNIKSECLQFDYLDDVSVIESIVEEALKAADGEK